MAYWAFKEHKSLINNVFQMVEGLKERQIMVLIVVSNPIALTKYNSCGVNIRLNWSKLLGPINDTKSAFFSA